MTITEILEIFMVFAVWWVAAAISVCVVFAVATLTGDIIRWTRIKVRLHRNARKWS